MALFRRKATTELERDIYPLSIDEWANYFSFNGNFYPLGLNQTLTGTEVSIEGNFSGFVRDAYKANGVVFACMLVRMMLFSEARFAYREILDGKPGDLHGGGTDSRNPAFRDLELLRKPWPNGTTGDLLTRMIQFADLGGNYYGVREGMRIRNLRPDWTDIVLDRDARDYNAEIVGYQFYPGGKNTGVEPERFLAEEVIHFAPVPDPTAPFRGMSWLTPVIREIGSDSAATTHKKKFFENGATVNLVVQTNQSTKENFDRWVELFKQKHESAANAYKTLFLASGQDATPVGSTMQQMDFKVTQGAGETRIAAASGIHPVVVGLSEGMQGSSLNAGNFHAACRLTADKTLRPLWRNAAASVASVIRVPDASELWYDASDVAFLREDEKDSAAIKQTEATTIRTLIEAGYTAKSVTAAVMSGDWSLLKHTGLFSVQLQAPGSRYMPEGEVPGEGPVGDVGKGPLKPPVPLAPVQPNIKPAEAPTNGKAPVPTGGK